MINSLPARLFLASLQDGLAGKDRRIYVNKRRKDKDYGRVCGS